MSDGREFYGFIEELKNKTDIVDVIGSYIPVKQKGRSFWANCPFHHEKTPSFCISREGQYYKCFGCGVSGDVIKFVEEYESLSFAEALETLASRVGMKLPMLSRERDSESKKKKDRRDRLLVLMREAAVFYNKALLSSYGEQARQYLSDRGIEKRSITAFGLGYSPDFYSLPDYLKGKGFTEEEMKAAGIASDGRRGGVYDVLFDRIIVPIIDSRREVVAFGGRTVGKKADVAKYKNTRETEIFVKSKNLYNINTVKSLKQNGKLNGVIVTEGYMDVICLGSAGIDNVCASMGTSLTVEQARLLKRFTDEVYICYDGDGAGQNATVRGMDILSNEGLKVKVMTMPDGLDPDELVRQNGKDDFLRLTDEALPLTDYKLSLLKKRYDMNVPSMAKREENRIEFSKRAGKLLNDIEDKVERRMYAQRIAKETGLSAEFLEQNAARSENVVLPSVTAKLNAQQKAMAFVAAVLLVGKSYADTEFIPSDGGESEQKIFTYIKQCISDGVKPEMSRIYDIAGADDFVSAVTQADTDRAEAQRYYLDCVKMLKRDQCDREIKKLRERLLSCPDGEQPELMTEIAKLIDRRNNIV